MRSNRYFLGLGTAALCSGAFAVVAACSGDDSTPVTAKDASSNDGAQTTDAPVTPPTCVDAGAKQRTCTAAACTQKSGEPATCVNDQCVPIKSLECQDVYGAYDDDDAIWVGSLLSLHGADGATGRVRVNSVALAVKEINQNGGVVTADGCNGRPLAYLACDDSNAALPPPDGGLPEGGDAGFYNRDTAAHHLIDDLKVVGITGPQSSNNTLDVFKNVSLAAKTLIMPPSSSAAVISAADASPDGVRLIWRFVPDDTWQDQALIAYVTKVMTDMNAAGKSKIKVAIIARNDAYGQGNLNGIEKGPIAGKPGLHVNGAAWTDASNAGYVMDVSYDVTKPVPFSTVQQVLAFQPDIIFHFGLGEFSTQVIAPYEDANNGGDGGAGFDGGTLGNKPLWITTSSGQRADLLPVVDAHAAAGLRQRITGTSEFIVTPLGENFYLRYQAEYPGASALLAGMPNSYDSLYLLAYGIAESKVKLGAAVASEDAVRGMANAVSGATAVDVGPAKLKTAMEAARQGEQIKVNGASGPLNFDPAAGQFPGDYTIWCIKLDPNTSKPVYNNVTGLTWTYADTKLSGAFVCP